MKKLISTVFSAGLLILGLTASAEIGDVVGYVYSTDILATVNGVPIPSYCLDGKTAVAVRDLENYGFSVGYYDNARIALVSFDTFGDMELTPIEGVERGEVGEVIGEVLETDIVAYINGEYVPTYNIGGRLVAAIEDIAPWNDGSEFAAYGYAKTGMTYTWDEESRTVNLITLPARNDFRAQELAMQNLLELSIDENGGLTAEENRFADLWLSPGTGYGVSGYILNRGQIYPITYTYPDGSVDEVGIFYGFYAVNWDADGTNVAKSNDISSYAIYFDMDKIEQIISSIPVEPRTFEEEIEFWENGGTGLWNVVARLDAEDYTVLDMRQTGLPPGSGINCRTLRIDREPLARSVLMREVISAPELYGDMLYYFRGSYLYSMDVYTGEETQICLATKENILNYLRELWNFEYEYYDESGDVHLLLSANGQYRIYYISEMGVDVKYRGPVEEAYFYNNQLIVKNNGQWYYEWGDNYSEEYINEIIANGEKIEITPYGESLAYLVDGSDWQTDDLLEGELCTLLYQTKGDGSARLLRVDKANGAATVLMRDAIECIGLKDNVLSYIIAGELEELDVLSGESAALEEGIVDYVKDNYETLFSDEGETAVIIYRTPGAERLIIVSPEGVYIHRGGFSELYTDGGRAAFKDGGGTPAYWADGSLIPGESQDFDESVYDSIVTRGEKII